MNRIYHSISIQEVVAGVILTGAIAALVIAYNPAWAIQLPSGSGTSGTSVTYDTLKQSLLARLNSAIAKLDKAESTIQNNQYLTSEQKTQLLNVLNNVETQ